MLTKRKIIKKVSALLAIGLAAIVFLGLIEPTKLLLQYSPSIEYFRLYLSHVIPVDIVVLLLLILMFSEKIILKDGGTGVVISLLIFSSYSFLLLHQFFPLFF